MKGLLALLAVLLSSWLFLNLLGALVVGALARFLLPGKDKVGWFTTIAVGFMGGLVANLVAHLAGWVPWNKNTGILGSLAGAIGLLLLHRLWTMQKAARAEPPKA